VAPIIEELQGKSIEISQSREAESTEGTTCVKRVGQAGCNLDRVAFKCRSAPEEAANILPFSGTATNHIGTHSKMLTVSVR
jgi:hypothetical protein